MNSPVSKQKIQDWITQRWVILLGRKIHPQKDAWISGPFGEIDGIGEDFIYQLAKSEHLTVKRNCEKTGLLNSINDLQLSETDTAHLSKHVVNFYENTSEYQLHFKVKWNPFFKPFGFLVNLLFSQRINQLNIPTSNISNSETLKSEIIQLVDEKSQQLKHTIWLRTFESTGKVIYSGIYGTCTLPSGQTCIKAVFPLPMGNATVIMTPQVGKQKELILDSSGKKFGDAGFYFLLRDKNNNQWAHFVRSFTDTLVVRDENKTLTANQTLKLWRINVATFRYEIVSISKKKLV